MLVFAPILSLTRKLTKKEIINISSLKICFPLKLQSDISDTWNLSKRYLLLPLCLSHVSHLGVEGPFRYWNVNRTAVATLLHFALPKARIYSMPPAEICKWHATPSDTISLPTLQRVDNIYRREIKVHAI